ncbi:ABC transporter ATP-binding protein [Streptosporangium lutulentum]|nr:ABC transporter ATP-binding protein [Streptosporangium lutulentum]
MVSRAHGRPVLRIEGLRFAVSGRHLFGTLSFELRSGESAVLCGPSGTGKTTLLNCIMGLTAPDDGAIYVAGENILKLPKRRLAEHRREYIGMVFQFGELLPELSPVENVAIAALLAGQPRRNAYHNAEALLRDLGVPVSGTPTGLLSGGERQRTAVARALITEPVLLLADEPTGALDQQARESVAELLFTVPRVRDCALLVVTHDEAVARRADRRFDLRGGNLAETRS